MITFEQLACDASVSADISRDSYRICDPLRLFTALFFFIPERGV